MADIAITVASVIKGQNGNALTGLAGVALTQGQVIYIDPADRKAKLADSNASSPANAVAGITLNAALANQPIDYVTADPAFIFGGAAAAGDVIYLSDTAGGLTSTYADILTGSTVIVLGVCVTGGSAGTATINLAPQIGGVKP